MPNTEHKTTEGEIKEIWERLAKGEASIKSAHRRLDSLEKIADSVSNLAMSTNQLAIETKALREDVTAANTKIENLEEKPIRRYDTIVTTIITALCSGVVGYFLSTIIDVAKG